MSLKTFINWNQQTLYIQSKNQNIHESATTKQSVLTWKIVNEIGAENWHV